MIAVAPTNLISLITRILFASIIVGLAIGLGSVAIKRMFGLEISLAAQVGFIGAFLGIYSAGSIQMYLVKKRERAESQRS